MSPDELALAFAWNGRRRMLLTGLMAAMDNLRWAGCRTVVIDGSFVTSKEYPSDWDAAFDPVGIIVKRLDPILMRHDDGRRAMNAKYLGDMFPWTARATGEAEPLYKQFFQKDRDGRSKGIVEVQLQVLQ